MSLIPSGFAKSAAAGGFYDHPIEQSLRFNDDDSAYLSRTPASAGNRKTWTWSGWVKRGNINTSYQGLFLATGWDDGVLIADGGRLVVNIQASSESTMLLRDTAAWYHIVVAVDTTQANAQDRRKAWVNGVQVTDWGFANNVPAQNTDTAVNNTVVHRIGRHTTAAYQFDGYMAEVHFIDGTALDASSFGEFKSGVWIPKAYAGSYGTNGFYLDFGNSGSIGADVSGNGNNWTANNLAATDVVLDSPTNNFPTLNAVHPSATGFSEGNLRTSTANSTAQFTTMSIPNSGKWYFEFRLNAASNLGDFNQAFGIRNNNQSTYFHVGLSDASYGRYIKLTSNIEGSSSAITATTPAAVGDVFGMLVDRDAGNIYIYKNGTVINSGNPMSTTVNNTTDELLPYVYRYGTYTVNGSFNFGQDSSFAGLTTAGGNTDANGIGDFKHTVPTDALALCTANLPDPVASIDPAQDGSPQDHFNTVLYTGTGSNLSVTGVGFQPDLVWIKKRVGAANNKLFDSIRGATKQLESNTTNAEATEITMLTSFDADGFTVGSHGAVNSSSDSFVGWNWKANGTGVSNTDGSITSTVSANTDAGFSIVSWAGNSTFGATVGHGLNSAPEMIILKVRDRDEGWVVGCDSIGWTKFLQISNANAAATSTYPWNDTAPTSSVVNLGGGTGTNGSGYNYIAYMFHSVEGFSKFGSYTGNDNPDGPFIYTGFRPAFVMIKNTSTVQPWVIIDNTRSEYNVSANKLYPNASDAENSTSTDNSLDILSNGFKLRGDTASNDSTNGPSNTLIYMAFASMPTKFSLAR